MNHALGCVDRRIGLKATLFGNVVNIKPQDGPEIRRCLRTGSRLKDRRELRRVHVEMGRSCNRTLDVRHADNAARNSLGHPTGASTRAIKLGFVG
ncbi:hypothetical protein CPY51_27495 [Rhizobium tubonense]|uniref:Uncharacterized protein n=1 Tax=Rhizobium tubonense TaxID=484088 RepID=A0A2W4E9R7_9HYPH|nr:hypothetical protein CPY51_27495 [Rhizobium tubonense]